MTTQGFNAHTKYRILQHALKSKNISETCKLFGISRTTFYNWQEDYEKHGMAGLENKKPRKPKMPNQISKTIEREILDYVIKYPKDGPRRIYYELKAEGFNVGETGIYNILKRNNLTRRKQRIEYSKNGQVNYEQIRNKTKLLDEIDFNKTYPGHLVIQNRLYRYL